MIDRIPHLSGDAFHRDYLLTRTPVVITHMMDDWPAMSLWNQHYLTAICGDQSVEVMGDRDSDPLFEIHCETHRRSMPFAEFAALAFSPTVSNNVYLVANNKFMASPGGMRLMQDMRQLPYLTENANPSQIFFWFGPAGTITPLHYDVLDLVLTQVRGSKHIRLYSPDQKHWLYNSRGVFSDVDVERPDFDKYPLFRNTEAVEFDLMAGEMLFLPQGHWHQVHSLTPSISVSFTNFRDHRNRR
jgi:ribosomal protein L16 Arg81 hydroxylase